MRNRVVTALVLVAISLGSSATGSPWPLWGLCLLVCVASLSELVQLYGIKKFPVPILGAVMLAAGAFIPIGAKSLAAELLVWLVCLAASARFRGRFGFEAASLWVTLPFVAIQQTHLLTRPEVGFNLAQPVYLCVIPVWAGDTFAIFAGKRFGKHPLAPSLSPGKTWEGALANTVACLVFAYLVGAGVHAAPVVYLSVGLLCAVLGQFGDLFESWLKRQAGVKDSGFLLPGHGGVLDRVDSLIGSAIPSCLVLIALTPAYRYG